MSTLPVEPPAWVIQKIDNDIYYNPKTGDLIWINNVHKRRIGTVAGAYDSYGYLVICFGRGKEKIIVKNHHIAYYKINGKWPTKALDHKYGQKFDNRIAKLRLASTKQNGRNRRLAKNNSTGVTGVRYNGIRYRAFIIKNGVEINLRTFATLSEAKRARRKAEIKYFGKFRYRHGN